MDLTKNNPLSLHEVLRGLYLHIFMFTKNNAELASCSEPLA